MASVEEGLASCFGDSFCGADMFGPLKKARRQNIRDPRLPAKQNSGDALNVPRRREMAAEGLDALINSEYIGPGINELNNATVGTGRRLRPLFNKKQLGWTDEQYTRVLEDVKCLWREDMESKRKWIDQEGDKTLAEMQRQVLEQTIVAGETYTLAFWFNSDNRPFRTSLAIIDNDRIRTPSEISQDDRDRTIAGHLKGPSGRTSGYYVHDYHRNDPRGCDAVEPKAPIRRYNEFGREQVIHTYRQKLPGMTRGLSDLTAAFGKLKCFEQYNKAKLEAAIMQTALAFVVKSNDKNVLGQLGGGSMVDESNLKKIYQATLENSLKMAHESQEAMNDANFNMDGVKAFRLLENEEAEILTANSAATNDKQFTEGCLSAVGRNVGGLSRATLTQDFDTSYSAARATLISFYRQAENLGYFIVDDWLQSVYALWLEDVIESGRLRIPKYPEAFNAWMHFVTNREWYCNAQFRGPARDEIDQAKSMTFWRERKNLGVFTFSEFYDSRGLEWQDEMKQQFEEMKFLDKLIGECPLDHIDPIAFIQGKLEAVTVEAPNNATQPELDTNE